MAQGFEDTWRGFRQEFEARNQRLIAEVAGAWEALHSLIQGLAEQSWSLPSDGMEPGKVESLGALFGQPGRSLLVEPLTACQKKRPILRALTAIQDFDSGLEDLVRRLPLAVEISGRELVDCLDVEGRGIWRRRWLRWHKSRRALPLRAIVSSFLHRRSSERAALDGDYQLLLSQACVHLLGPWQACRRHYLSLMSGGGTDDKAFESEQRWWTEATRTHETRAARLLEGYRNWTNRTSSRLATAVLQWSPESSEQWRTRRVDKRQVYFAYWARQQRAIQALLDLELALVALADEATRATARSLDLLQAEHIELLKELGSVIAWLETWSSEKETATFPPPQARLMTAEDRVAEWVRGISGHVRRLLPATIESVAPRRPLPGFRSPWRQVEPVRVLAEALERDGRQIAGEGFQEAEAGHRAIVREIERAREVVMFGFEAARSEGTVGIRLAEEATANALSLLQYQKRNAPDARPLAERSIVGAQATVFLESYLAFEKGRLGLLSHVTRQRGLRAAEQLGELASLGFRRAYRQGYEALKFGFRWSLERIGWIAPTPGRLDPVSTRAHLGEILEVQFGSRDLPMLYRRLFRLEPVEDPRFLVGRDAEMLGLADALSRWESGGPGVAVIVVGARDSGKTSLLNCAAAGLFARAPVVRGQFCRRLSRPDQMKAFLAGLLPSTDGTDLDKALAAERRVVILEEFERTFLRTITGFEGLREFLRLMEASAESTLWIVSINETSFRYLDVVAGLSRAFSHRINAMSVKPEDIRIAILQRHNLSGFRLHCSPPPESDARISRARRFLGLEHDPQELFFEALYHQSEGIFRSAFELWQECIERIEGGIVFMRQPLAPNYRPLLQELAQDDLFLLQAVLQHGSLTEAEAARIFGASPEQSLERLKRLQSLEVLEPEPVCPGFRVRPEAGRFVRDALHRHNLL